MRARRAARLFEPLIGIACVLAAWEIAARVAGNATLVPSPAIVWSALVAMRGSELPRDIAASIVHLVVGYAAGAALGLILALVAGSSKWFAAVIDPFAEFLRPISPYGCAVKTQRKTGYERTAFLDFYRRALDRVIAINREGRFLVEARHAQSL